MLAITPLKWITTLIVFLCFYTSSLAQIDKIPAMEPIQKNAIYGNVGTAVLIHTAALYYERQLQEKLFYTNIVTYVKVGVGYYELWDWSFNYGGPFVSSQYGILTGAQNHLFEAGLGLYYSPREESELNGVGPSVTLGYRYINPNTKFMFRSGLGVLDGLYIGIGKSF
jgi:hypothetical protein